MFLQKQKHKNILFLGLRFAIRNFRISDFGISAGVRPHRNFDIEKTDTDHARLFHVFEKPKTLNRTLAFCYGFRKTDAKLRGAILGFDPRGFSIGFCENTTKMSQDLPFQMCGSRFGISGFQILGFWLDFDSTEMSTVKKLTPRMPVSGFRKTKNIEPNDSVLLWFSKN